MKSLDDRFVWDGLDQDDPALDDLWSFLPAPLLHDSMNPTLPPIGARKKYVQHRVLEQFISSAVWCLALSWDH